MVCPTETADFHPYPCQRAGTTTRLKKRHSLATAGVRKDATTHTGLPRQSCHVRGQESRCGYPYGRLGLVTGAFFFLIFEMIPEEEASGFTNGKVTTLLTAACWAMVNLSQRIVGERAVQLEHDLPDAYRSRVQRRVHHVGRRAAGENGIDRD